MNRAWAGIIIVGLVALVIFSLHLAGHRIYQVDECAEIYTAKLLATGQAQQLPNAMIGLLQFPLALLARHATISADLFTSARFVMAEIFWLNVVLLALATGEKLLSGRGMLALLCAATLAPMWDYGFEIRHDNLLLTGLLLTWCVVRVRPAGLQSYILAGTIAVAMQAAAHKAFAYFIPLTLAILLFPPPGHGQPRWKLSLAWLTGAIIGIVLLLALYRFTGATGLLEFAGSGLKIISKVAVERSLPGPVETSARLGPGIALVRLVDQTPLLLALLLAAAVAQFAELRHRGRAALIWTGTLPEALLFFGSLGILLINPTPYPYNLLHVVPYGFLFAYRYTVALAPELLSRPSLVRMAVAVLLFTHLSIFAFVTRRHLDWPNDRQVAAMSKAEELTDADKDPVFDGIGLVPTRPIIHPDSFMHGTNVRKLVAGNRPWLREMLVANPAAVILPNYRTTWLGEIDQEFIREHYVPLADDFWVLGKILPAGGGSFEIIHPGRYCLNPVESSCISGTFKFDQRGFLIPPGKTNCVGKLDGQPWTNGPVELAAGKHRIETAADCQPTVVWVGPRLESLHPMTEGSRLQLFFNWY